MCDIFVLFKKQDNDSLFTLCLVSPLSASRPLSLQCSVPCGVGQRSREVVCLSNLGEVEDDEECNMNLKPDTLQNCDMGACARSWFTSLWSQRVTLKCEPVDFEKRWRRRRRRVRFSTSG